MGGGDVAEEKDKCFVIMPISDPDGYDKGHFESVYKDIFAPAIEKAGYTPHRVDEDASSGLIQAKIIENLINAPMAICDLSTRNPNVLFELGIRQAYDKPVVLVQEAGTKRIFDINGISCIDYDPSLIYRSVLDTQDKIANAIQETEKNPQYNSLVTALSISAAKYERKSIATGELDAIMLRDITDKLDSLELQMQKMSRRQLRINANLSTTKGISKSDDLCMTVKPATSFLNKRVQDGNMNDYSEDRFKISVDDNLLTRQKIKALEAALRDSNLSLGQQIEVNDTIAELKKNLENRDLN